MVAWTCRIPAVTAAIELATASSASLWVWIPHTIGRSESVALDRRPHGGDDPEQLVGHRPAVGVAQDEGPAPAWRAAWRVLHGVSRVVLVAVEEVFGVVHGLTTPVDQEADRVGDHVEVLGRRRAQDLGHVEQPALAEDGHHRGLGGDQLAQVGVVLGSIGTVAGRAEGSQPGGLPALLAGGREEVDVLGVRARPATLDEGHPVLVEHPGDAQLVGQGQDDVLALGPIAQGRVVEDDRAVVARAAGGGGSVGVGHDGRLHGAWRRRSVHEVRAATVSGTARRIAMRPTIASVISSVPTRRSPRAAEPSAGSRSAVR